MSEDCSNIKFYLHHEDPPEFTMVVYWDSTRTENMREICQLFADEFVKRTGSTIDANDVNILGPSRQKFNIEDKVASNIKDRDDVYAVWTNNPATKKTPLRVEGAHMVDNTRPKNLGGRKIIFKSANRNLSILADSVKDVNEIVQEAMKDAGDSPYSLTIKIHKDDDDDSLDVSETLEERLAIARDREYLFSQQSKTRSQPQKKEDHVEHILKSADGNLSTKDYKTLMRKATEYSKWSENPRKAAEIYKKILEIIPNEKAVLERLVTIYLSASRPNESLKYVEQLQVSNTKLLRPQYLYGKCYLAMKDGQKACELFFDYIKELKHRGGKDKNDKLNHDVQVVLAKACLVRGDEDLAFTIIQGVLSEDPEHYEARIEYGSLLCKHTKKRHLKEEGIQIFLKAIVDDRNDTNVHQRLSKVSQSPGGYDILRSAMGNAIQNVNALVFIGSFIRNYGAINQAIAMFELAAEIDPEYIYAPYYVANAYLVLDKYQQSFKAYRTFLKSNPDKMAGGLPCSAIVPIIVQLPANGDIYLHNEELTGLEDLDLSPRPSKPGPFSDDKELYLFGIYCNIIKLLFMKGCLKTVKPLLRMLDTVWLNRSLERTTVRSDALYFALISHAMHKFDVPPKFNKDTKFIYMIGDSHVISPAWREINYRGKPHVIHPVLVVGTKIWYIQEDTDFFAKQIFWNAIKVIPDGATVIFCMGELDCNTSMDKCVRRMIYDTIADAIESILDVYIPLMSKIQKQHNWTVFVHPVPPCDVHSGVKEIFWRFNSLLKSRLYKEKDLHWINVLGESTRHIDQEYRKYFFDGTHLSPDIVKVMEECMNSAQLPDAATADTEQSSASKENTSDSSLFKKETLIL